MAAITINGITLDPTTQGPSLASAKLTAADASTSNYILVQTKWPLKKMERDTLEAEGAKILEYVPENTYVCSFKPADLHKIRDLPFVSWANIYMMGFKINSALIPNPQGHATRNLLDAQILRGPQFNRDPYLVDIVLHKDADLVAARNTIAQAAGVDADDIQITGRKVRLSVSARRLPKLAAVDEVRHIEPVSGKKLANDVARGILAVGGPSANGAVLEGEGQVVAVCDTGFDKGSTSDVHPAFTGRVAKLYALGRPGKQNDPDGHGTHVAGSVLGDGTSASLGVRIAGTAPKARLVLQSVIGAGGGLVGIPTDLHDLFDTPYAADQARVHTNSWSNTTGNGEYNSECHDLDDFVWNHRDMVVCFAAGNEGVDSNSDGQIDRNSIKPPSTAKNCITVGASENLRSNFTDTYGTGWPTDFPAPPIASDAVADNSDGMVAFSSRGPTLDQRIKPDVVAPGTYILSTRSRDSSATGWGLTSDPLYFFDGGTSMATPLVAGCVALLREFVIKQKGIANPTAALVKAMLINGATDMPGQYSPTEAGQIPNINEGFGRVNVGSLTHALTANQEIVLVDEKTALDTGDSETITIDVPPLPTPMTLKATLVWTDPAGAGLQNDLDLIVRTSDGTERHGNQVPTSSAFDRVNNIEQVVWNSVPTGRFEIVVKSFRSAVLSQPYALVIRLT